MKILVSTDLHYLPELHEHYLPYMEEMKAQKPDLVINPGDWGSHDQPHFYGGMKLFRDTFTNTPIIAAKGNHDLYQDIPFQFTWEQLQSLHKEWFWKLNIDYVGNCPFRKEGVTFIGFDGWYNYKPNTKDAIYIVKDINGKAWHDALHKKADEDLQSILDIETTGEVVGVTHFPPYPDDDGRIEFCANLRYMDFLAEKCNFLCTGHSHIKADFMYGKCRVLNPGNSRVEIPDSEPDEYGFRPKFFAPNYTILEI